MHIRNLARFLLYAFIILMIFVYLDEFTEKCCIVVVHFCSGCPVLCFCFSSGKCAFHLGVGYDLFTPDSTFNE